MLLLLGARKGLISSPIVRAVTRYRPEINRGARAILSRHEPNRLRHPCRRRRKSGEQLRMSRALWYSARGRASGRQTDGHRANAGEGITPTLGIAITAP
ncbi:hypothetical protein AMELA_G00152390 [Ameiurus melas]|uniref:Uncharacterized protein n=1 Tax=Ameiurus melas TaxID=219545 RepID=A0A7J6AK54_AMEME|nr:hypothetical protein AMELA_G00152390 [Ameiurus melas]